MGTTRVSRRIAAPPSAVYAALLDPRAVERWRVPDDMTCVVHEWDPREGGRFRASLSYDDPARAGKTAANTDTYGGHFARLVPGAEVVEVIAFESGDAAMAAEMTMTTTLADAPGGGTEVTVLHEGVPDGVRPEDNEAGTRMALDKLAALVEGGAA